ncbi:MAG: DUF3822 family protein [Flavobacteriaceae bacterium]|nr:DUF3822 family protein [Flavobacteriaceae bacterium]MDH3795721.1 DUF3822 family protein [Flavobacteriaceae bacterium]
MTKKEKINTPSGLDKIHKLSIQVSLNGLSFCILDTISNSIVLSKQIAFKKDLSPYEIQRELKELLREYRVTDYGYSDVVVIHRNTLFSLVPKSLFDENELANYMKFNIKILANDMMAYDEIDLPELVNVYVPFMNINNYVYDLFGEFDFLHNGTVLIQALLQSHSDSKSPVCYVHVADDQMDITVLEHKKLKFYNSFYFDTKEDFIYYLLFTLEQLGLDPAQVGVRLFGSVKEGDELYDICYEYVSNTGLFYPSNEIYGSGESNDESIDFTVLNAF